MGFEAMVRDSGSCSGASHRCCYSGFQGKGISNKCEADPFLGKKIRKWGCRAVRDHEYLRQGLAASWSRQLRSGNY